MKKFCTLLTIACLCLYLVSVVARIPKSRQVWDVSGLEKSQDTKCGIKCPNGQFAFYVKTGVEKNEAPTICFEDTIYISPARDNGQRGINAIFIDYKTGKVLDTQTFDTYLDEYSLVHYLKSKVEQENIMIAASFDEMTENLKTDGVKWLKLFGGEIISDLMFRDSYMIIGQKGLQSGYAIEFMKRKSNKPYAPPLEKAGCFAVPMGPVGLEKDMLPQLQPTADLKVGENLSNCGRNDPCPADTFPVMLYTGEKSEQFPQICVSGQIIMTKDVNGGGRGLNFVVVNPETGKPSMASNFDTYDKESINMEDFLESLSTNDIILGVAFDDAFRKLQFHPKELLNKLGSSQIQNLKFRDVWYFVGQKGIDGFTPYEKISFSGIDAEWPTPLKDSFCLPKKLTGLKVIPDPPFTRNEAKRAFCTKYDGYADFCDSTHMDDPVIKPVGLTDASLKNNIVYSTPILIIPGMNHNALVKLLETTLMQPGVDPKFVVVAFDDKFPEHAELAGLFGIRNHSLTSSITYSEQMNKALEAVWTLYPLAANVIVLEEELLLASDFLYFMAQCAPIFDRDETLFAISAFNYNGFVTSSGNRSLVYRVEDFPGLAFMLKKSVFDKYMKGKMKACCSERTWYGWSINSPVAAEVLVPDVSRVYRQPYESARPEDQDLIHLFHRPRLTNADSSTLIKGLASLVEEEYEKQLIVGLKEAIPVNPDLLLHCQNPDLDDKYVLSIPKNSGSYVIHYLIDENFYKELHLLCRCFGLFAPGKHKPKNLHRWILRFVYAGNDMYLVGHPSKYSQVKAKTNSVFKAVSSKR
ncbi:hypothetical protein CHS0354_031746 [Potamilus streckersoni]|uniref:ILEI/PANDER domain-containing protein n=1 Tax=Potamilus streckersoni TaxID=2493646 RepID=A0AAE0T6M9_9BIVA|nr:hypothetical protein CHS0354_031746 [Potamilus streckersoni]